MAKLAKDKALAKKLISSDQWLKPFSHDIELRMERYLDCKTRLTADRSLRTTSPIRTSISAYIATAICGLCANGCMTLRQCR